MDNEIIERLRKKKGFIAALDQSGGSSMKTLTNYGYNESDIKSEDEMFELIHKMRSRIISSPAFDSTKILGVILFKNTMEGQIDGVNTVKYLESKGIVSFLKIDKGLEDCSDGVQLLKDIPDLDEVLAEAKSYGIVGTKMRSVIREYNEYGIRKLIQQQFALARKIIDAGLIPIVEPEIDINAQNKRRIETFMHNEIHKYLAKMKETDYLILKLSLPEVPNYYNDYLRKKCVLRVVALSGGYTRTDACEKLYLNKKMIASFSRALLEGLNINQTDEEFNEVLRSSIEEIYRASISK